MKVLDSAETGSIKATATTANADPIFAAIEAHRAALAAFSRALDELDELEGRLPDDVKREPRVPIIMDLKPDFDLDNLPVDTRIRWCRNEEEIVATLPDWVDRDAGVKFALAQLEKNRHELAVAREACGLTAMQTARDQADKAEEDAALALLDIRPTTIAGVVALLTHAADYEKTGNQWPTGLFDEQEIKYDPRYPNDPGQDWSFFLHRMLAETLAEISA